jgi:hypothetical protein
MTEIETAMRYARDQLDSVSIDLGVVIHEKVSDHAIDKGVQALKADPTFKNISEKDLKDFVKYFADNNAASLVFAPEVVGSLIRFARDFGFPTTYGGAKKTGLEADRYSTKTLLNILVGAKVLTVIQLRAEDVIDFAKMNSDEYYDFKENPDKMVDVYEWNPDFLKEVGYVLRDLKVKEEQIMRTILGKINEKKENQMKIFEELDLLENKINKICEKEEKDPDPEGEEDFFLDLDDDMVEDFIDGILVVLGKLEQNGQISRVETAQQAKEAVIAVVRRLYQKRGLISKLGAKYARFGAKRELRTAKKEIGKALA